MLGVATGIRESRYIAKAWWYQNVCHWELGGSEGRTLALWCSNMKQWVYVLAGQVKHKGLLSWRLTINI